MKSPSIACAIDDFNILYYYGLWIRFVMALHADGDCLWPARTVFRGMSRNLNHHAARSNKQQPRVSLYNKLSRETCTGLRRHTHWPLVLSVKSFDFLSAFSLTTVVLHRVHLEYISSLCCTDDTVKASVALNVRQSCPWIGLDWIWSENFFIRSDILIDHFPNVFIKKYAY